MLIVNLMLIFLGFALLIKGADFLVDGASNVAKKFNIPQIVIGLTIVAIGTSMPELVVSVTSALSGYSDMSIGNIVGSNIANLFLILGICSIINPLIFKKETRIFENPFTIFVTCLLLFLANNGGDLTISRNEGMILLGFCVLFIIYNIVMAKKGNKFDGEEETKDKDISVVKSIVYIIIGIIGLKFGGDLVVNNAEVISKAVGISEKLISLTIVAFSTSLPELITSMVATKKGEVDMAIGNIIGSQVFNILLIIGVSSVLTPINYSIEYNRYILLLVIGTVLFALYPYIGEKNKMTRSNGIIFVIIYAMYMASLVYFNI